MSTRKFLYAALLAGAVLIGAVPVFCSLSLFSGMDLIVVARCPKPIF